MQVAFNSEGLQFGISPVVSKQKLLDVVHYTLEVSQKWLGLPELCTQVGRTILQRMMHAWIKLLGIHVTSSLQL